MKYSICVIDDEIPATGIESIRDTELLNSSNLQFLLQQEEKPWTDEVVKQLIQTLLTRSNEDGTKVWEVYGYTNPAFYLNMLENGTFRSDIVTFDWDYPGTNSTIDSESLLKEILDKSFSLVFIFSKADKKDEIDAILAKPGFLEYKGRLFYLDKAVNDEEQTAVLLQKADDVYKENFSFRFANALRRKAAQTMDRMLSDMGKASLNDVKNHIANSEKKDFIDFLAEKFRFILASKDIYDLVGQIPEPDAGASALDESIIKKIWSYRLYFRQEIEDDIVRCGDIAKVDNAFYFVLSADCDLRGFWKKNLGVINMVALYELDQANMTLKEWLAACAKAERIHETPPKHLLDQLNQISEGPFVFPFVPINDNMKNFLAIPKDLVSRRITYPNGWETLDKRNRARVAMKYSYWAGAKKLCTVSEPFLTPVVKHVLNTIAGNGVPDYPGTMQTILKQILEDFAKATEPATPSVQ